MLQTALFLGRYFVTETYILQIYNSILSALKKIAIPFGYGNNYDYEFVLKTSIKWTHFCTYFMSYTAVFEFGLLLHPNIL